MKFILLTLMVLSLLIYPSCLASAQNYATEGANKISIILKKGMKTKVITKDRLVFNGKLISIDDSLLIISTRHGRKKIRTQNINRIDVFDSYNGNKAKSALEAVIVVEICALVVYLSASLSYVY